MNYLGNEERKFNSDKADFYSLLFLKIFSRIVIYVICVLLLFFPYSDTQYTALLIKLILVLITAYVLGGLFFVYMILAVIRLKCFVSICENGIKGRANRYGSMRVELEYADIFDVRDVEEIIVVRTKRGVDYVFFGIKDAALCANIIASKIGRI